ncbi:MAG: TOBE domain-containing protein, partial [Proteobacteria bacterium]|nr:TOBE domain-containing protein [Pseudomonadota bacterium]
RALLSNPRLLLMDEPLASIDESRRGEILPFIERLRDKLGLTIVYVSHATDEIIRLADKVIMLNNGRVAANGTVQELMSRLDLKSLMAPGNVGAVLTTTFAAYDSDYDLASLNFDGGTLRVPGLNLPEGTLVRAQILSRDLALSLSAPINISVLNVFPGTVTEIGEQSGPQVDLRIDVGTPLIATVTRKSLHDLKIEIGTEVYAMVKAVAIDRRSLGPLGARAG